MQQVSSHPQPHQRQRQQHQRQRHRGAPHPPTACALLALLCAIATTHAMQHHWRHWGGDLYNSRYVDLTCIDTERLEEEGLAPKWVVETAGCTYTTPAVCHGMLYTVDHQGFLYKFSAAEGGEPLWRLDLNGLGIPVREPYSRLLSRATPILTDDCTMAYLFTLYSQGSWLVAVHTTSGQVAFHVQVDDGPYSKITQSGVFYQGSLYVGTASAAEDIPDADLSFKGSMLRLDASDGREVWRTRTCPRGYGGCGIWGSSPVIDEARGQVCVGTGNNYMVPKKVMECKKETGRDRTAQLKCMHSRNYADAMVCFDLDSGKVKWGRPLHGVDVWTAFSRDTGPDWDFAQAPILVPQAVEGRDLLIGTSKSGRPIALDPADGSTVWGPLKGERSGFSLFGSCTNGKIYCYGLFWYTTVKGSVICVDVADGKRKWRWSTDKQLGPHGPLTCTQEVLVAPMFNKKGTLMLFDIEEGDVLAEMDTGVTLFSGPAIVGGVMYFGTGYINNGGVTDNKLMAVPLPLLQDGSC